MSKEVIFLGDSEFVLAAFPAEIKLQFGHEIYMLEEGLEPPSAASMKTVGIGVWELRAKDANGQYRVFYYVKREDKIYILHAFQKKTQQTSEAEKKRAKSKYNTIFQ